MERISTLIYEGGLYRFSEFAETVTDAGGFVLRREDSAVSTVAVIAIADVDLDLIRQKAREIGGGIRRAPLAGSEIAVVAPSPSGKHLPHPTCDIAEFLRRSGAQTLLISLARGAGQEPMLEVNERRLIEECDLVVFVLGDSKYCLQRKKNALFSDLKVPVIVTGGPILQKLPRTQGYVRGFGRKAARMKSAQDLNNLAKLVALADKCLAKRRDYIYSELPEVSLPALKEAIEDQIPEISRTLSPSPITIKLDGLRIKLSYCDFQERVSRVVYNGENLREFATIAKSVLNGHLIVKLKPVDFSPGLLV